MSRRNFYLLFILAIVVLSACSKEGSIGLNTQPVTDAISAAWKDTSTVITVSLRDDSLETSQSSLMLLGSYMDPIFGKTSASIFTQLSLANNGSLLDFTGQVGAENDLVLDSAVLCLQYTPTGTDSRLYYGNLDPQTIKVYQLLPGLPASQSWYNYQYPLNSSSYDSAYYSNRMLSYNPKPIGSKTFVARPDSDVYLYSPANHNSTINTVYPYTVAYPPHIRIRIDSTWASQILLLNNTSNIANSQNFQSIFPGLYIAPDNTNPAQGNGRGGIFYIDPYASSTKLILYYRRNMHGVGGPKVGDTLNYAFEIDGAAAHFNHFDHNYTGTPVAKGLTHLPLDTARKVSDSADVFVQSMAGLRTYVTFPHIMNWIKNGPIVINRAELLVKLDGPTVTSSFNAPPQLYLVALDSTLKTYYFPIDFSDATSNYSGTFNGATNEYSFNIPRHIQAILEGKKHNLGFYILSDASTQNAQRVVLYGAGKVNSRTRLRITYTQLQSSHKPIHKNR
jgi:hypothetical protein